MMASSYYQNLIKRVLEASTTDNWEIAVREWDIVDCEEDEEHASECVCGKENLRYLFTIRNRETGRSLYPIGSSCIEKFERDDLDYEVDVQMDMYRLAHAMERGERIELTSKYFSKKLLYALYEEGAFAPNKYNRYDGTNDYQFMLDMFNKRNKSEITEQQQKALTNNMDKRVEYEVMNMMKSNMRVLYGQPTAYMPVLYKEAIYGYLDKILVTKKRINESVQNLMKIDYSVFYREVLYSNVELKINHESCMKNVYPDVILFPLSGVNASMWQEVGGKNKATPGRFVFPILSNTNIDDMMVKMFGRFRWELCRCIQGMQWNDVKVKSLTSEYMDYIQFYRKNRDLSDEAREKVKLQIQKGRNNSREIFLIDYEAWIKSESNGSMKMNKVAREIVATYCPFEKTLREKLGAQRPYEIAMARFGRNSMKKKQEFELRIKAVQRETPDVPQEIPDTYHFYADL